MYCKKCGFDLGENSTAFCPQCGGQIEVKASGIEKIKGFIKSHIKLLVIVLALIIVIPFLSNSFYSHSCINIVKNGVTESYPDITCGEAFESFFSSPEWKYFESDDGDDVVEFQGVNKNESSKVKMQFIVDYKEETFEFWVMLVDGEEIEDFVARLLLIGIFEDYAT